MKLMRTKFGLLMVTVSLLSLSPTATGATPDASVPDFVFRVGAPKPAGLHPGDIIRDAGGLTLKTPNPGFGVSISVLAVDGDMSFGLHTDLDGDVLVSDWGPDGDGVQTGGGGINGPPACGDDWFVLKNEDGSGTENIKWYSRFDWWYKLNSEPGNLSYGEAVGALQSATANITTQNDNCGLTDQVSATAHFEGGTNRSTNIEPEGITCGTPDGYSVAAFGSIANSLDALGVQCDWDREHAGFDEIYESDVRLDSSSRSWTVTPGTGCSGSWSVEAVMTHERGHTFGLADVADSSHPNLTMSGSLNGQCQNAEATLGLGDVLGLQQLY